MTIEKLQKEIHDIRKAHIDKVLSVLREDPDALQWMKDNKDTEELLWGLIEKDGSLLLGMLISFEKHLEI